jgi:hypothetical protein
LQDETAALNITYTASVAAVEISTPSASQGSIVHIAFASEPDAELLSGFRHQRRIRIEANPKQLRPEEERSTVNALFDIPILLGICGVL